MANPINLQKPLEIGGQPIYPPTTAQQVVMPDGTRLNAYLEQLDGTGNGVSPTVDVSKSGTVTTLTIIDKDGTKTAQINDGTDGKTPVKGADYFTSNDKAEMVTDTVNEMKELGYIYADPTDGEESETPALIDADTLGGILAEDYATKEYVEGFNVGSAAGGGLTNTYGEEIVLLNEIVEIPIDTPVTSVEFDLPEVAKELRHFGVHIILTTPTNTHTAGRTLVKLFGTDLIYWNVGNSNPTNYYQVYLSVDWVRRIVTRVGPTTVALMYNMTTMQPQIRFIPELTEVITANNQFRFEILNEYAGTITVQVFGYR